MNKINFYFISFISRSNNVNYSNFFRGCFFNSSQHDLDLLKIVRDNKSKIFLNNLKLDTEINDNFKYFYDNRIFD